MTDEFYMRLALDEAWKYQLLTYPNPAVGAVVIHQGRILSIQAHQQAGTSHAEVLALVSAYEVMQGSKVDFDPMDAQRAHDFLRSLPQNFFSECSIYVTLEPCSHEGRTPSCASLLKALALERVVIGTADPIEGHGGGAAWLNNVTIGVQEEACRMLIEPFVIWQERAFVLFKLAQTSNGRIATNCHDRYLSCQESLEHVHRLRGVCERLLIGGNTVRTDRPTLDCRFTDGRAPDVMICSKGDDLDTDIPLFGVPDRQVTVGDDLSLLDLPSFVMVEGGEGMLRVLQERIDWLLIYQTPKLSTNQLFYNIEMHLTFLHQVKSGADLMIWSRQRGD